MKNKTIEIRFTPEQWVEIYYSVHGKLTDLKNKKYDPGDKRWINALADILDEIETKVEV